MCLQSLMKNGMERVYKSDNESPFSVMRNSFETAQISPTKKHTTPRLHVRAVSSECAFTASKSFHGRKKKERVIFSSVSLWVILAAVSIHQRPSPTESSSVVSWTPLWRISQNHKHTLLQMYVCSCNSQQSLGVLVRCIFVKKLYLKWNLSRTACGKHCHFRETAKLYKAFPPKGST